ncbi:MAG: hypothetical protein J6C44_10115 [Muribaculaceae bacterium]|nr:hypothetical protein [Muribaculaceae bacterium]
MNKQKQTRRVSSKRVHDVLVYLADTIQDGLDRVNVSLEGETFSINLEGCDINITINRKGGEK